MATYFNETSKTFNEYILIPNLTDKNCIPSNVKLRTPLVKFKKGERPELCDVALDLDLIVDQHFLTFLFKLAW